MKIADFGLARDIHHIDYYKKTTNVSGGRGASAGWAKAAPRFLPGMPQPVRVIPRVCRAALTRSPAPWCRHGADVGLFCVPGSSAGEVDGPRGSVRPNIHSPERRVSSSHGTRAPCPASPAVGCGEGRQGARTAGAGGNPRSSAGCSAVSWGTWPFLATPSSNALAACVAACISQHPAEVVSHPAAAHVAAPAGEHDTCHGKVHQM